MIVPFQNKHPKVDPSAFVAQNATVIGDVEIGPGANIWFQSVVRGDSNYVSIGSDCNIQDSCVIHVVKDRYPTIMEEGVVLGHRVVAHGCHVKRGALIGIGALVLDGAVIGEESIIGAGSVVSPRSIIPPGMLAMGTPARVVRPVREEDVRMIRDIVQQYLDLKEAYRTLPA
jgi:carbonic anhydrase/acetyltransferase-like protein (isoleucine patch superfamily)